MSDFSDDVFQSQVEKLFGAGTPVEDLTPEEVAQAAKAAKAILAKERKAGKINGKAEADVDAYAERLTNPRTSANKSKAATSNVTSEYQDTLSKAIPQIAAIPGEEAGHIQEGWDQFINPGLQQLGDIDATQSQANLRNEQALQGGVDTLQQKLGATQAQRTAGIAGAKGERNAALGEFGGQVADANSQTQALAAQLQQQLSGLNEEDRQNYLSYLGETDPNLAALVAQGSDAGLVGNQTDVLNRYKEQLNPEIGAQERLLGELARRKFEGDDKSSRDAQFKEMQARGLNSGGQQIAQQQATRQQLSQDRLLSELGMSANAVGRSERALQGYAGAADTLRNADDKMRNFSDTYAQNDAIRRQGVSDARAAEGRASTLQRGDRNVTSEQEGQQAVRDVFGRNDRELQEKQETTDTNLGADQYGWDSQDEIDDAGYKGVQDVTGLRAGDIAGEAAGQRGTAGAKINAGTARIQDMTGNDKDKYEALLKILELQGGGGRVAVAGNN